MAFRSYVSAVFFVTVGLAGHPPSAEAQPLLFVRTQDPFQQPVITAVDLASNRVVWQESALGAEKLAVTGDGHYLLISRTDSSATPPVSSLVVRDLATGASMSLAVGNAYIGEMAVHPRRLEAYLNTFDRIIRVDASGASELVGCENPSSLTVSTNGAVLAAICDAAGAPHIGLIDTGSWTLKRLIPSIEGVLGTLVLNADGSRVFASEGGDLSIYDAISGTRIAHGVTPPLPADYPSRSFTGATRNRDGLFFVVSRYTLVDPSEPASLESVTLESHIRYLIDPETLSIRQTLPGGLRDVQVEMTPDDRYAIIASGSFYLASLIQAIDLAANTELARSVVIGPSRLVAIALTAPPLAPAALAAAIADRAVTLTWSLPDAAPAATTFVVEAGSRPGASDLARLAVDGASRRVTVPGVPPGRYYVRLRGVNYAGTSTPSNEIVVQVP